MGPMGWAACFRGFNTRLPPIHSACPAFGCGARGALNEIKLLSVRKARQVVLPLKNRRDEYTWGPTRIDSLEVQTDKKLFSAGDTLSAGVTFRVVGGLREAFHPDVWTVAWEDFDKIVRLTMKVGLGVQRGPLTRKLVNPKKEVRRASFYWSRDPDLPYRIWPMIVPEDGGPPKIPHSVEDAKTKMLDVERTFKVPASSLGRGRHRLVGTANVRWGRRSFIEKGSAEQKSKPLVVQVE